MAGEVKVLVTEDWIVAEGMLERIGRYEILERIASGGQGTVYRARDTTLDRVVAIKVINQPIGEDTAYLEALQREASLAARLEDSYITTVYDFQVEDDKPYIVMEYVPDSLDRHLTGHRKLSHTEAVTIAIQVCRALGRAHKAGVIHRDIKPQNILLTEDGSVKVSDFSIARALASSTTNTATHVLGSPPYMPVEQWTGGHVDGRSDIYSLGVLLFEMLTGERPYSGDSFAELYVQHKEQATPDVPTDLGFNAGPVQKVVHRAMEKRPEDRFATAEEMAASLEELLIEEAGLPPLGRDLASAIPAPRMSRATATAIYFGLVMFAIAASLGGLAAAGTFSSPGPIPSSDGFVSVSISPANAARLVSGDGGVIIDIEPATVDESAILSYQPISLGEIPPLPSDFLGTGRAFDLSSDSPLMKPVLITVALSSADTILAKGIEGNLVIQHHSNGAWTQLETQVDFGASTAIAQTASLSPFALTVRETGPIPTVAPTPTQTPAATNTQIPTATPEPTLLPTSTPKPVPTATAVPAPTPTPFLAYRLSINGIPVVGGQTQIEVANGTITISDEPRFDDRYAAEQLVTLVANPSGARSEVFWGGVDNQNGSLATVRMGADRFVTITIELIEPTPTPPPTPTPTPEVVPGPGEISISVLGDRISFDNNYFTASSGELVTMTLNNVSTVNSHNWVLVEAGTTAEVASAGALWPLNDWIPADDPRVLASTRLVGPGDTGQVAFTAPAEGIYQFVCTFPGHNITMFGAFVVTPAASEPPQ